MSNLSPLLPSILCVATLSLAPGCASDPTPSEMESEGDVDTDSSPATGEATETDGDIDTDGGVDSSPGSSGAGDETSMSPAECGDGEVGEDEVCDDGINDGAYGGCASDCMSRSAYCGDGEVNGPETCELDEREECTAFCQASGAMLWRDTYNAGGPSNDGLAVNLAPGGDIVVAGQAQNPGTNAGTLLRRYDSSGTALWTTGWADGNGASGGLDLGVTEEEVIVNALTDIGGADDTALLRFSAAGELLSAQMYETSSLRMDVDRNGQVAAITSPRVHFYDGSTDLDFDAPLWSETLSLDQHGVSTTRGVALRDGVLAVSGNGEVDWVYSPEHTYVRVYDTAGALQWTATDTSTPLDTFIANLSIDPTGAILEISTTQSDALAEYPDGQFSILVRKWSSTGTQLWTRTTGLMGGEQAIGRDVCGDANGHVIAVGLLAERGWIAHYDQEGATVWEHEETQPGRFNGCVIDDEGGVVVVGHATPEDLPPGVTSELVVAKFAM